ncbi:hypothetical protein BT63DRAFT_422329 [Microthyrium microscopicum]|uniref:SGNH hydrolase n=1 Tax=Microthyrium microscopicum TaxID=703497 RepID=A0A6A6UJV8_9PEZI|nr:hypothetical protein BT63DRAFT_422329 [Microthyrium microscopicum]
MAPQINTSRYYLEWKGHQVADLTAFHSHILSSRPDKPVVYLAGDSSLDNKFWVQKSDLEDLPDVQTPGIYQGILKDPKPKPDVAFWLNHALGNEATALNTAVEESMLRDRDEDLLEHDKFIRDHIRAEDVLIVSVGANDIALRPTKSTMWNMFRLAWLTPRWFLERGWALGHFKHMFKDQVQTYISRLVEKTKPKAIIVCMIYYPLERTEDQSSWADMQLKLLGYDRWPSQLQTGIRKMYELATQKVQIPGTTVVPCALFEVLDGKNSEDYTARVEPSCEGGRKMAVCFKDILDSLQHLV